MKASQFFFIADDPCLDFLNTRVLEKGKLVDRLENFRDLVSWLRESSIGSFDLSDSSIRRWEGKKQAGKALEEAKRFREVLRDAVSKRVQRKRVPDSAIESINRYLSHRNGHPILIRKESGFVLHFQEQLNSPTDLLIPIAEAAAHLLCHADFSLVKKCENSQCVLFFYDITKNHARRWCSMMVCGNRHKVAAYYERLRNKKK